MKWIGAGFLRTIKEVPICVYNVTVGQAAIVIISTYTVYESIMQVRFFQISSQLFYSLKTIMCAKYTSMENILTEVLLRQVTINYYKI